MTTWLANLNGFQATTAKTNTFKLGVNNIVNVIMHYFTLIQWTQIEADSSIFAHYTSSLQDCMKIKVRKTIICFTKQLYHWMQKCCLPNYAANGRIQSLVQAQHQVMF